MKSMTGYSKSETNESGVNVKVEIKTLNGRYLEINSKLPRSIFHKELEIRDIIKSRIERGNVSLFVTIEYDGQLEPFSINMKTAEQCYNTLNDLKKQLKIREAVKLDHVLHFSSQFQDKDDSESDEIVWKVVSKTLRNALTALNRMRQKEGTQLYKDFKKRLGIISNYIEEIEAMGIKRIPDERERLRQKVAQLFESDEIDEHRIQTEIVLLADKLDISEECVRLRSHIKYFHDTLNSSEAVGKKINFLLQEMHRETNTIGSKINDAHISQIVVTVKEELERIREQIQNVE
jgi:uncharacterized protein (TIGR00255 family)